MVAHWEAAKRRGTNRSDFCKHKEIKVKDLESRRVKIVVRGLRASHFELYESSEMTESADLRH